MRHTALREQLRRTRHERALSQAGLAARSGTSRVTIARLEAGSAQDVRVGTLSRLCAALGLELRAVSAGGEPPPETLLARERERGRRLECRLAHAALAVRLLAARAAKSEALVARARAAVDRWERERLCSRHYITRWRAMLKGPIERVAGSLLEPGDWGDALFQNSPWSFALERPEA
jgi:transcriptional regulator with XRE-family HTH domain